MSNNKILQDAPERAVAKAELALLLAITKTEECRELEDKAWEENTRLQTHQSRHTALVVQLARMRAEAEETMCRLQLEVVS